MHVKAFPLYGGMGVSAPSLHRESTDSLIRDSTVEAIYYLTNPQLHNTTFLQSDVAAAINFV